MSQEAKRIWDNYKVVATVRKTDKARLQFAAAYRDGLPYIHIREFYWKKSTQEWKPGLGGISMPYKYPHIVDEQPVTTDTYEQYIDAFKKVYDALLKMPIADEANEVWAVPTKGKHNAVKGERNKLEDPEMAAEVAAKLKAQQEDDARRLAAQEAKKQAKKYQAKIIQ